MPLPTELQQPLFPPQDPRPLPRQPWFPLSWVPTMGCSKCLLCAGLGRHGGGQQRGMESQGHPQAEGTASLRRRRKKGPRGRAAADSGLRSPQQVPGRAGPALTLRREHWSLGQPHPVPQGVPSTLNRAQQEVLSLRVSPEQVGLSLLSPPRSRSGGICPGDWVAVGPCPWATVLVCIF